MIEIQDQAVLRDGETIATVSAEGVVTHAAPLSPTVKSHVKKALAQAGLPFSAFALLPAPPPAEPPTATFSSAAGAAQEPLVVLHDEAAAPAPLPSNSAPSPPPGAGGRIAYRCGTETFWREPGEPEMDPRQGVETPAWKAWHDTRRA